MENQDKRVFLEVARSEIASVLQSRPNQLYQSLVKITRSPYSDQKGCFVTLRSPRGSLRGCIGTIVAEKPLIDSVVTMARQAAFCDPRFLPVGLEELEHLVVEISVLTEPQGIAQWQKIRPGIDGVILTCSHSHSVFLPQVATEQGWDLETMLSHLCLKAGLTADRYRDSTCTFEIFQAEVFSDESSV